MGHLVRQYQAFRANLAGYVEVPFADFRLRLAPLRGGADWPPEAAAYVAGLAAAGGGHALQALFGPRHRAAAAVLGEAPIAPAPMPRAELDAHMRALVRSCLAAGWPPERFAGYAAYLGSGMTPRQLADSDRPPPAALFAQAAAAAAASAEDVPEADAFADAYRRAGPAYRRAVDDHFARAAERARAQGN